MANAFRPTQATVTASGSTTSTTAQALTFDGPNPQVRIFNAAGANAYINFGKSDVGAATTASYPIAAGATEVITLLAEQAYVRVILASSTGNVHFTPGIGL